MLLLIIYLAFISLGLPDALLGSAWPMIHLEFGLFNGCCIVWLFIQLCLLAVIGSGILTMLLPLGNTASLIGLIFIGFGCAPINHISVSLMPIYLLAILILMLIMHEQLCKKTEY